MTYTLQQISEIFQNRHYLNKERMEHYFPLRFGHSPEKVREMWNLWDRFPRFVHYPMDHPLSEELFSNAMELMEELRHGWNVSIKSHEDHGKDWRLVIYSEDSEKEIIKKAEVDLANPTDIISYADLIKRSSQIHAVKRLCDEFNQSNSDDSGQAKYIKTYDGDIFSVTEGDTFVTSRKRNGYYLCEFNHENGHGIYYKLLYLEGKGYLDANGDPIKDEKRPYTRYALSFGDHFRYIGNITTDSHLLIDNLKKKAKDA